MDVGDSFSSFAEVQTAVKELEDSRSLSLYIRDSRTVLAAKKKGVKRAVRQELVYYSLQYACYHGGKKFTSRSKGSRPTHRYFFVTTTALCL